MNIIVFYRNWRGERVEIPCSTMAEAREEKAKLAEYGIHALIEDEPYFTPQSIVAAICEEMGAE